MTTAAAATLTTKLSSALITMPLHEPAQVQLQHNENKSQAIRRLLDKPGQSSAEEAARALGLMLGDDEDDGDDA
eukprot:355814-Chlamydomonas_euryale.AAC.3